MVLYLFYIYLLEYFIGQGPKRQKYMHEQLTNHQRIIFFITLLRLRLGFLNKDLAPHFYPSPCSNIFKCFENALIDCLQK